MENNCNVLYSMALQRFAAISAGYYRPSTESRYMYLFVVVVFVVVAKSKILTMGIGCLYTVH